MLMIVDFYSWDSFLFLLIKRRFWVVLLSVLGLHQWGNKEIRNNLGEEKKRSPEPDTTGMVELERFGPKLFLSSTNVELSL